MFPLTNPLVQTVLASSRLRTLGKNPMLDHAHGGHNGFLEDLSLKTWYEREMVRLFDTLV